MIAKGFDGRVPTPGAFTAADQAVLTATDNLYTACRTAMDKQAIKTWLDAVWAVIADADRWFATEKPFDKALSVERKGTILYVAAEIVRQLAILVLPAMPDSGGKLLDLLGQPADARSFAALGPAGRLKPGTALPAPVGIFPRYIRPEAADAGLGKPAKQGKSPPKGKGGAAGDGG